MSSPLSNLKKSRKIPLPAGNTQYGHRTVPFRDNGSQFGPDESQLLQDVTESMTKQKQNQSRHKSSTSTAPSDQDLLSIMMARLTQLEQKLQNANGELTEKDKKINILEDKVRILKKSKDGDNPGRTHDLEKKCLLLQQQVHEMETFLADYGMVWVGAGSDPSANHYLSDSDDDDLPVPKKTTWNPGSSVVNPKFKVNFDIIVENIKELNVLANEGVAKVQHTTDGARLKIPDPVPLTLYSNGIVMFSGPFRPYDEPLTQQCIRDIQDGYFPLELQKRYPDGIPFALTDKRNVFFKARGIGKAFQGDGHKLGGSQGSPDARSRLVPVSAQSRRKSGNSENLQETDELPGPQLTVEQFLNHLPKSVVRNGKIIDIRNSIGDQMQGSGENADVKVIDTPGLQTEGPGSSQEISTLRVKAESGDQTYVIKLGYSQTIADLRAYIDRERPKRAGPYEIMSTFPKRTYTDDQMTLEECGLVPSATLLLKAIAKR